MKTCMSRVLASALSCEHTSKPFSPGMFRSSTATLGCSVRASSRAARPSPASRMSALNDSNWALNTRRMIALSSAIRTLGMAASALAAPRSLWLARYSKISARLVRQPDGSRRGSVVGCPAQGRPGQRLPARAQLELGWDRHWSRRSNARRGVCPAARLSSHLHAALVGDDGVPGSLTLQRGRGSLQLLEEGRELGGRRGGLVVHEVLLYCRACS